MQGLVSYLPTTQFIALSLMLGIVASLAVPFSYSLVCVPLGITALWCANAQITISPKIIAYLLVALLGYSSMHIHKQDFTQLTRHHGRRGFSGRALLVASTTASNKNFPCRLTFQSCEPITHGYYFWVFTKNPAPCAVGEFIELEKLRLHAPANSSVQRFMQRESVIGSAFAPVVTGRAIVAEPSRFELIQQWVHRYRHNLSQRICSKLSKKAGELLELVFLGYRAGAEQLELKSNCLQWGISHYLARSGLHVMLLFMLLNFLLGYLPLSFRMRRGCLLVVYAVYASISWVSLPFLRATIIIMCMLIAQLRNRQHSALHLINLFCILTLLWNPVQLFFLDFQLSCGLSYVLILTSYFGRLKIERA